MIEYNAAEMRCSVWLMPRAGEALALARIIGALADRFGAPRFEPHVTLLGDIRLPADSVWPALLPPVESLALPSAGLGESERRFESVFIRLRDSDGLRTLRATVAQRFGHPPPAAPNPHVSLIYPVAVLPPEVRRALCAELADAIRPVYTFDRLAVVRPGNVALGWEDVRSWEYVAPEAPR